MSVDTSYTAPVDISLPEPSAPPQMNTLDPKAAYAAFARAPSPATGLAVPSHFGVHEAATHERPRPHELPQPLQFSASAERSTQRDPQGTSGAAQVSATQTFPLHTFPAGQSLFPQHSKHPTPAQHSPAVAQGALDWQLPLTQVSVVQESPSLQSALAQHCWHSLPQSRGVFVAQAHTPSLQTAPGLHTELQAPQFSASIRVSVSQPETFESQSAKPVSH